jgi:ABC-type Fe3+-hydroxamate transport system substrate-binding protein
VVFLRRSSVAQFCSRAVLQSRSFVVALSVVALFAVAPLSSCGRERQPEGGAARSAAPYGIDDFGDTIRPPARVTRIVSLNPTTTEILFAIGAGTRVVGRTQYDQWPDSARLVADLGPGIRPNVEAVIGARPDLVLLYGSEDNRPAARRLQAAGIATAAFKVDSIAQFDRLTRLLGRIVGDSARGALVADTVMRTLDSVRSVTRGLRRPTVVIPTWNEPLIVIGGGSFMNELVTIAGGRNVYDSFPSPSPTVSYEDVLRRNPEYILTGPEAADRIRTLVKWRTLPALRAGRVLLFDTATVLRPATRIGEGAVSLARLLHPELRR